MICLNFKLEKKEYDNLYYDLSIDNQCDRIVSAILSQSSSYFSDVVHDTADISTNINPILLELMRNVDIQDFIDRAICEFNLEPKKDEGFDFILRAAKYGVYLFYCEQLHANADIIAQNALIRYVNDMTVKSNIYYDSKEIESFIESYIEGISIDTDDRLDSIIADFESELLSEFDIEIMEVTK